MGGALFLMRLLLRRSRCLRQRAGLASLAGLLAVLCLLAACTDSGSTAVPAQPAAPPHPGKQVYQQFCFSCHAAGIAGAPITGDAAAWAPRAAKGRAALLHTTIAGIPPGMPAMGLCFDCSEAELNAAIDYMIP